MFSAIKAAPVDVETAPARRERSSWHQDELDQSARLAARGDALAVRDFLRATAPLVRSICRGVMGRDNPELEDAIQESMIDVVRALPQFRFEAPVSHYVTKIVLRRAIAVRQRARARLQHHTSIDADAIPAAHFDDGTAARADLVRNLLDNLSESQATVLRLRLMLGHSIRDIASITGVSENTVKTRLRLGKDQLRRRLQRSGEGPRAQR